MVAKQAHSFRLPESAFSEDETGDEFISTVRCNTYQLWEAINRDKEKTQREAKD